MPALVAAWLAAACGFSAPAASGIDAPTHTGPDATPADPDAAIDAPPPGWLHPWRHRKPIALLASKIEAPNNGALTDFPVLVSLTDQEIVTSSLTDGADIVFTAADGTTVLASEMESFTLADRKLVAWVKIPSLSATVDTAIFLYYGNSAPPAKTPEAVWTASYLGVWHLNQDPDTGNTGAVLDSTSGNHDGTATHLALNDLVPAKIGTGLSFDGSNDYLGFTSADVGNTFTISMWLNLFAAAGTRTLLANSGSGGDADGFRFFINTAGLTPGDRRLIFETGNGNASSGKTAQTNTNAITAAAFTHVVAVVNRSAGTTLLYINGASVATATSTSTTFGTINNFDIGRMKNNNSYFSGLLDEIEIATELRSPEWLRTSFNNQSVPGNFYRLSAEETEP